MNKIAIIDDNMVFRKITKMLLKKIGVPDTNILLFKNGNEIYELMNDKINSIADLPNILLLDLNMPIMNGWEFIKAYKHYKKAYNYTPKIYIITSSVDDKDYKKATNFSDIEGFFTKPIDKDILKKIPNIVS